MRGNAEPSDMLDFRGIIAQHKVVRCRSARPCCVASSHGSWLAKVLAITCPHLLGTGGTLENHPSYAAVPYVSQTRHLQQVPQIRAAHANNLGGARARRTERRDSYHR